MARSVSVRESGDRPRLAYSELQARSRFREASDRELLAAVAAGDELALDELIRRKSQPLLQLARRMLGDGEEARDVVQMTFVRVWQNRGRFDASFSPNTWLYRIASNLAIDQLRSRRSRERAAEPLRHQLLSRGAGESAGLSSREREVQDIFRELSAVLSRKQRLVFVLRELEGLSSSEVAEIVGCRESTVRNHLFNARRILRRELLLRYPEYASRHATPEAGGAPQ
jgi:RNA polymerase sigma-70 factor (ECF subfamily)